MRRLYWCSALVLLGLLVGGMPAARADHSAHGRVSAVNGDLLVKGPDDKDWSYLDPNGTVYDQDSLWSDTDSLAELEMERGAWLRLGKEMPREPLAYAAVLYGALHNLDAQALDWIAVEQPPDGPEWAGVLDRLRRAAG